MYGLEVLGDYWVLQHLRHILSQHQHQGTDGKITATTGSLVTTGTWSGKAGSLTDIGSNDAASSTNTWRRIWFSYNDNTTGRPAYSDKFVFQTSTNTLKIDTGTLTATQYSGNAATATTISTTGGTTGNFWRGDNSWSNTIVGAFNASSSGNNRANINMVTVAD